MIQLFVRRSDLVRSEPVIDGPKNQEIVIDIIANGQRDALNVKPDGYILRGNTREYMAKLNGDEYIPISLKSFLGLFISPDMEILRIRQEIIDPYIGNFNTLEMDCEAIIPPKDGPASDFSIPLKRGGNYYYYRFVGKASFDDNCELIQGT